MGTPNHLSSQSAAIITQRLEDLRQMIGVPALVFRYLVLSHPSHANPIQKIASIELRAQAPAAELKHLGDIIKPKSDTDSRHVVKQADKDYQKWRRRARKESPKLVTQDGRRDGWKRIAVACEKLREYFGKEMTDTVIYDMLQLNPSSIDAAMWTGWDIEEVEARSGIVRWMFAATLGYLFASQIGPVTKVLASQTTDYPNLSGLVTKSAARRTIFTLAVIDKGAEKSLPRMTYDWFSGSFDTQELMEGRGVLPFQPVSRPAWEAAKRSRDQDQRLALDGLRDACEVLGVDEATARTSIRFLPWPWYRWCQQNPNLPGVDVMSHIITYVAARSGRTNAYVGYIWNQLHHFLDPMQRHGSAPYSDAERAKIRSLNAYTATPHDLDRIAPDMPMGTLMFNPDLRPERGDRPVRKTTKKKKGGEEEDAESSSSADKLVL